jgi:hypothetical protein
MEMRDYTRKELLHIRKWVFAAGLLAAAVLFFACEVRAQSYQKTEVTGAPSNIVRLGSFLDEKALSVESTSIGRNRLVTATRTPEKNLRVMVWEIDDDGELKRLSSIDAGYVSEIALCRLGNDRVVTAVRTKTGTMKLISWYISGDGSIERGGSAEAGMARCISIAAMGGVTNHRVVTALRQSDNTLKLITWYVIPGAPITRMHDISVPGEIKMVSIANVPMGNQHHYVATSITTSSAIVKVLVWKIDKFSKLEKVGESGEHGELGMLQASPVSYGRIAVTGRGSNGALRLLTFDIDEGGTPSLHSEASAGIIRSVSLAALSATRIITALTQENRSLKVINWDTVDGLRRLGDAVAGDMHEVSVSVLDHDRFVTSLLQRDHHLKLIVWNECSVSLLRSRWGQKPDIGPIVDLQDDPVFVELEPKFPQYARKFEILPWDSRTTVEPRLAVGKRFMIYIDGGGHITFLDKNGGQVPSKYGELTDMPASVFFEGFIRPTNADGTVNQHNINRHLGYRADVKLNRQMDPNVWPPVVPAMTTFYDTRAYYDIATSRFVIATAVRSPIWYSDYSAGGTMLPDDYLVRRYHAFAVSRSDDPRDGFYQYLSTESSYSDWPVMAINNGMLIFSYLNGPNHTQAARANEPFRPSIRLYAIDAVARHDTHPASCKIYPTDIPHGNPGLVNQYGDANGWNYVVRPRGTILDLYYFKTPADFQESFEVKKTSITVGGTKLTRPRTPVIYRNGKIHYACGARIAAAVPDKYPEQWNIRLVRIPLLNWQSGDPQPSTNAAQGYLDLEIGGPTAADDSGDKITTEFPAIAVNHDGHILISYGRTGLDTAQSLFPEARYTIYYDDGRGLMEGQVLQPGEFLPTMVHTYGGVQETTATARTHYDWAQSVNAAVDPNGRAMWFIHGFADTGINYYRPIVGKIIP